MPTPVPTPARPSRPSGTTKHEGAPRARASVAKTPKTHFDWSALPSGLLRQLKDHFGIQSSNVARALATRFGSEPDETFVKEAWPALRDRWVAKDPAVRRAVVTALRAKGLGSTAILGRSAQSEVAYLRSCRNSAALRAIVLPDLLALGHSEPHRSFGPDELRAQVKKVVRSVLGLEDVLVDEDGDIPVPSQASLTYVRVFKDVPVVRVFSPVLWGFGAPSDIEATVNDINRNTNWVKAIWENGAVVLFSDVVGDPLAESQLAAAIHSVVHRADEMGPVLQEKYGGRTAFGTPRPPKHEPPVGGYL